MYSVPPDKCSYHSSSPAVAHCTFCGRAVCRSCAVPNKKAKPICRPCALQNGILQRRSTGIAVLGVLSIIAGSIGIMCIPFWVLFMGLIKYVPDNKVAFPGYETYGTVNMIISAVGSPFAMIFGFGLLLLRDWARKGTVIYNLICLAWMAGAILLYIFWLFPAEAAAGIHTAPLESAIFWAGIFAFHMWYIIFFTRPMVKVQFGHQLKGWTPASVVVSPGKHR